MMTIMPSCSDALKKKKKRSGLTTNEKIKLLKNVDGKNRKANVIENTIISPMELLINGILLEQPHQDQSGTSRSGSMWDFF